MTLGTMVKDVFRSAFSKPVTQPYPVVRSEAPKRYRGKVHWTPDKCTGCQLCVKDCPAYALELHTVDKATKRFVMEFDMARCTYCSQCVVSCRFDCLSLAHDEWELAASSLDNFSVLYGREENVAEFLAQQTPAAPQPAA